MQVITPLINRWTSPAANVLARQRGALSHGDFNESYFIGDLECPKCFELIAYWQAPLSDKDDTNSPSTKGL